MIIYSYIIERLQNLLFSPNKWRQRSSNSNPNHIPNPNCLLNKTKGKVSEIFGEQTKRRTTHQNRRFQRNLLRQYHFIHYLLPMQCFYF